MQSQIAGRVQILLTLAILVAAAYLIGVTWSFVSQLGTFMLFFFAWLLASLLKPLVVKMTGAGLSFGVVVLLVYIIGPPIALGMGYLLVSTLAEQVAQINIHLDEYTSTLGGLEQGSRVFGGVRELLEEQFARLSALEQSALLWLAILREPVTFEQLLALFGTPLPRAQLLDAVDSLRRRSLIEPGQRSGSFTLHSVVLEFATARLIAEAIREIQ